MGNTASFSTPEELEAILANSGYDLSTIRPASPPDSDSTVQKEILFKGYIPHRDNEPRLDELLQKYTHQNGG